MQLITPEEVLGLAFSPDDAIEAAHIRAYRIEAAQLRYIRPAFGEAMYRKMILEQYDSFVSGYIRPALAHYVRYELIGELAVRVSDRGAVRPSAEESEQTTSATRSDQQDRTDTSRQELSRMQVADKTASDTTRRTTTSHSSSEQNSDESLLREEKEQRTTVISDTDRTTSESDKTEQSDTELSIIAIEESVVDQSDGTRKTTDDTTASEEEAGASTRSETSESTSEVSGNDTASTKTTSEQNDVTTREVTARSTGQTANNGTGTTMRRTFGAATTGEWQLLARQALRDARTFLRYAVEYVESHRDEFPEYAPLPGFGASCSRRCIGGIVM